jgi:hypothetical protein
MRKSLIWLSLVVLAASTPALADEIVYFTNGTSMVIETHAVDDTTQILRVQLAGAGMMEFPFEQVSKIEDAQGVVSIPGQSTNVVVRGRNTHRIEASRPARHRRESWELTLASKGLSDDVTVANGLLVTRPYGNDAAPNKRKLLVTGSRGARQPLNPRGSRISAGVRQGVPVYSQNSKRRHLVAVSAK